MVERVGWSGAGKAVAMPAAVLSPFSQGAESHGDAGPGTECSAIVGIGGGSWDGRDGRWPLLCVSVSPLPDCCVHRVKSWVWVEKWSGTVRERGARASALAQTVPTEGEVRAGWLRRTRPSQEGSLKPASCLLPALLGCPGKLPGPGARVSTQERREAEGRDRGEGSVARALRVWEQMALSSCPPLEV